MGLPMSRPQRELPIDVVEKIIIQLRAEDLSRYKAVCRSWFALIKSPRFINKHFLLHQSSSVKKIIYATNYRFCEALSLSPHDETPQVYVRPPWTTCSPMRGFEIVGSSNGILCLVSQPYSNFVCLWNPSTMEHRMVPCRDNVSVFSIGFGYDARTGDYKVLKISTKKLGSFYSSLHYDCEYFVEVWSMSTLGWRQINSPVLSNLLMDTPQGYYIAHRSGFFNRGKLNWVVHPNSFGKDAVLISFDVGDETFHTIEIFPDNFDRDKSWALVDFMGSIAMPISKGSTGSGAYYILVLGDDRRTWTYQFTIGPLQSGQAFPEGVCIDGQFLMRVGNKYFLYNPLTKEEKALPDARAPAFWEVIGNQCWSFVESLESVRSEA